MPSPSKIKGSSFERDIAKYLSDLYGESFIRAPGSGAYVGGKNQSRKEVLHEGQIRSFKGDIVPGESFSNLNVECKSYADFPFHLVLTGSCKQLDEWLDQLMTVAEPNDLNVLFMKFNRKGKFVCVPSKYTWVTDQFMYYTSNKHADWVIIEFNHFFQFNKDTFKAYSGSTDNKSNTQSNPQDTKSITTTPVNLN
jgi:Holliday junction resolvase